MNPNLNSSGTVSKCISNRDEKKLKVAYCFIKSWNGVSSILIAKSISIWIRGRDVYNRSISKYVVLSSTNISKGKQGDSFYLYSDEKVCCVFIKITYFWIRFCLSTDEIICHWISHLPVSCFWNKIAGHVAKGGRRPSIVYCYSNVFRKTFAFF